MELKEEESSSAYPYSSDYGDLKKHKDDDLHSTASSSIPDIDELERIKNDPVALK